MDETQKDTETETGPYVIEDWERLSRSKLWEIQRTFYDRVGVDAWGDGMIPHWITCNPFIADAYAATVLSFLRDCRSNGRLETGRQVYIVEMGSGSGRFGYQFITRLRALIDASLSDVTVTLVMTDFADSRIEQWRKHPQLKGLVAQGALDFARFDAAAPTDLRLVESDRVIASDPASPMVLIANYMFDSIPIDCFSIRGGRMYESRVAVAGPRPDLNLTEPEILGHLDLAWELQELGADYYDDPDYNAILTEYTEILDDTALLFPIAALECIKHFREIADPLLVLAGDKGYPRVQDLLTQPEPSLVLHGGCFSFMVNFDAIARYVDARGGRSLLPGHRPPHLPVGAFLLAEPILEWSETARTYTDRLEEGGPDDLFAFKQSLVPSTMHLEQLLAYLRMTHYDTSIFMECFSRLLDLAPDAPEAARADIHLAVRRVWENYFSIGEPTDVAVCLGLVLSGINYFREAIEYHEHSLKINGPNSDATFGIAVCHYGLRELDKAIVFSDATLRMDPGFAGARALRAKIKAQLENGPTAPTSDDEFHQSLFAMLRAPSANESEPTETGGALLR